MVFFVDVSEGPVRPMASVAVLCLFACFASAGGSDCLSQAVPANQRKDLKNLGSGESYPIGVWVNDWAAGHLTATAAQIVIQEVLGYNAELKGPGPLALDGFFALTGCSRPSNSSDRGCGPKTTYVHINLEVWTAVYSGSWDEIQVKYSEMAPKNLLNMGYYGVTSMYVPSTVQERAYEVDGINLDFWRDYNASRQNPGRHFASPGDLDVSQLLPCTETALMLNEVMTNYVSLTGDAAGVVTVASGELTGRCFDSYFWYAPGCRDQPSSCFTWFTGGNGWGMFEMLVKATTYNMPLATAVASNFSNYGLLPQSYDMMLYWWVPDPTFLRLTPRKITFPEHDPDEWASGNRRTAARDVSIDKHVSRDLSDLAPEVEEFIARLTMSLSTVNAMMLDQLNTEDSNRDVACRWLRANEASWSTWVPEKGKCFSQFGMYDEQSEQFLVKREGPAITCRACPSGHYSSRLEDDVGVTFICKACESGSFQTSGASVSCNACPSGSYQNETGSLSCNRCPVGQYQDSEGSSNCTMCPPGTTTFLLGSVSMSDCGCEPGSINVGSEPGTFHCVPCGEGLECPFASTVGDLKSGQSSGGFQVVPAVLDGYYSTAEEPLEILQCRPQSWCPKGPPGTCAHGLEGKACAVCPEGQSIASGECQDCGAITYAWLAALPVAVATLPVAYYLNTFDVQSQASPLKSGAMASGLAVSAMQSLAMIGMMSAKWPATFESTSSSLQFFILDLDSLSGSCITGPSPETRYVTSVALFPLILLCLVLCYATSRLLARCGRTRPWQWPFTISTCGLAMQLAYGTMAAVAFKPLMCYRHPNGSSSLISYPNLFCGSSGHILTQVVGISFLCIFVVGFFVLCVYVAWSLPGWCAANRRDKVQCFRFFLSNFRFDAHWFMVVILLRGFGFAFSLAIGTNVPAAQTALTTMVLTMYMLVQALMLPWKVPLINVADMLVNASLLVLVNRAIQTNLELETQFSENTASFFLVFMVVVIVLVFALSGFAVLLKFLGVDWSPLLSLGRTDAAQTSKALKACAEQLLQLEDQKLAEKIKRGNPYDTNTLERSILLISEITDNSTLLRLTSTRNRVNPSMVNSKLVVDTNLGAKQPSDATLPLEIVEPAKPEVKLPAIVSMEL